MQEWVYEFKAEFMNGKILKIRKRCRKLHDRDRIKKKRSCLKDEKNGKVYRHDRTSFRGLYGKEQPDSKGSGYDDHDGIV